jgi:hypothetical protein
MVQVQENYYYGRIGRKGLLLLPWNFEVKWRQKNKE